MEQNALHDFGFIVWSKSMIKSEGIQFLITLHNREADVFYHAASIALTLLIIIRGCRLFFRRHMNKYHQVPLPSHPGVGL